MSKNLYPYPLRYRLAILIAGVHLLLVALGASYLGYDWTGPLGPVLDYYGNLSGSGDAYGFFAPGVGGQLRAVFDVTLPSGTRHAITLETGASHEAALRTGNIIDQFYDAADEDEDDAVKLQRSLSSSLAGSIFKRFPDARAVTVRLENFTPVSMGAYRQGERPRWHPLYQAKFVLNREGS